MRRFQLPTNQSLIPGFLLVIHAVVLAYCGWCQSPTLNEPSHLVAGLSIWNTGKFSVYRVNPPLVKLIASLPVALCNYNGDFSRFSDQVGARPESSMGAEFIRSNRQGSMFYFRLARLFVIPLSLVGGWICYRWAKELFNRQIAGLLACTLWCFSPMVIGNASLIAPDAHSAALGLAACYTFWRWLRQPSWRQAIVTGVVLGIAELSKSTLIIFFPLWPLLWVIYRWQDRSTMTRNKWLEEAGMLVLRMAVGLYVLNLGYLGEGSFIQLKQYKFVSQLFSGEARLSMGNRFTDSWVGMVPVPLPADYLQGIDLQQRDFENFPWPSYLKGNYQEKGWWYFYLYAILVKAPLGTLCLLALAGLGLVLNLEPKLSARDLLILLGPAILIFVIVSIKSGFSHHSRYVLPCIPFVFVWLGGQANHAAVFLQVIAHRSKQGFSNRLSCILGPFVLTFTAWMITSSMLIYPHSLSYFNEAAGGPRNGPQHLLKSSIDWGQDLLFLRDWIESNAIRDNVYLAFDNFYTPFDLEIDRLEPWPFTKNELDAVPRIPDGYYAISVNLLYEFPWAVYARDGNRYFVDSRPMGYLRQEKAIARAGYSIRIFSAEQVRRAYSSELTNPLWVGEQIDLKTDTAR